jgi:quercetin dioxygenase-like cupin family protein
MDLSSVSSFFSSALVFLNSKRLAIKKSWGGLLVKGDNFTVTGGDFEKVGEIVVYEKQEDSFLLPEVETVKVLYIEKGKNVSLHFHVNKTEIFYVCCGKIKINLLSQTEMFSETYTAGDTLMIRPGMIHSMEGLGDFNCLLEVSSLDDPSDSYRITRNATI